VDTQPNYKKGAAWGAFFGILALVLQKLAGMNADSPSTLNYYAGGAIGGALIGLLVVKFGAANRR
jgi:hypothetical protein